MYRRRQRWWLLAAVLTLISLAPAQDLDELAALAAGSSADRQVLLLFLEDARIGDVDTWRALFKASATDAERAAVVRGMSRVRDLAMKSLADLVIGSGETAYSEDYSWALAQWIGEIAGLEELDRAAPRLGGAALAFAIGQLKRLPAQAEKRQPLMARFDPESPVAPREVDDRGRLADPVAAALIYGTRVGQGDFHPLAFSVLEQESPARVRERAALYYLYRHPVRVPRERRDLVARRLRHADAECAGFAAWALARADGSGETEAARITAAYLEGGSVLTQVDRLRALAFLPPRPSRPALLGALRDETPALRRVGWETVRSLAKKFAEEDRSGMARFATVVVLGDPSADVQRAAIEALARLDRKRFLVALPALRLAGSWTVRGGAAVGLSELAFDQKVATWSRRFLQDPDVRVRARVLEGIKKALARGGEELVPERLAARLGLLARDTSIDRGRLRKLNLGPMKPEIAGDPVTVSLACQILAAVKKSPEVRIHFGYGVYCEGWLQAAFKVVAAHEAELLQGLVDLAASTEGEEGRQALLYFLKHPEISIRLRAAERLKTRNEPGQALRRISPDEQDAWLVICRARQKFVVSDARPVMVLETDRGTIRIALFRDETPGTIEYLMDLTADGFFDGLALHRVVPAFVAQGGCPRGDSWGGSGQTIRCEITPRTYRRGVVGMALAGKDTGGCQWFIAQRRVPQLDGGYTIFGEVTEGLELLSRFEPGERILKARIVF